jgi:hypothetical protein
VVEGKLFNVETWLVFLILKQHTEKKAVWGVNEPGLNEI